LARFAGAPLPPLKSLEPLASRPADTTFDICLGVSLIVTGKAATAVVSTTISGVTDGTVTVAPAAWGAPSPLDSRMPFLAINFIVCMSGIYPSRE